MWDTQTESSIYYLKENLSLRQQAHLQAREHHVWLHRVTYLPILFWQTALGIVAISTVSMEDSPELLLYMPLSVGIMQIVLVGLDPIRQHFNHDGRADHHEKMYTDITTTLGALRLQLSLPTSQRLPVKKLFQKIKKTVDDGVTYELSLPKKIRAKLQRKILDLNTAMNLWSPNDHKDSVIQIDPVLGLDLDAGLDVLARAAS